MEEYVLSPPIYQHEDVIFIAKACGYICLFLFGTGFFIFVIGSLGYLTQHYIFHTQFNGGLALAIGLLEIFIMSVVVMVSYYPITKCRQRYYRLRDEIDIMIP